MVIKLPKYVCKYIDCNYCDDLLKCELWNNKK